MSSCSKQSEHVLLQAAVNALQNVGNANKISVNEKDKAFCNFMKLELNVITNESIKDDLVENITLAVISKHRKNNECRPTQRKTSLI